MEDEEFEWDDEKAESNLRKHGISFEDAKLAFKDIFAINWPEHNRLHDEERYNIVGVLENRLIFIVYTMRGNRIRLVSARGTEPHEKRFYYDQNAPD